MATKQKQKIDLDSNEQITFAWPVKIPTPTGAALEITFTFLHRTREELAALGDARIAAARERWQAEVDKKKADADAAPADPDALPPPPDLARQVGDDMANDVASVREVATAWDIEGYEFNDANLTKLFNKYQAAPAAIAAAYRDALSKGRLGN